MSCGVFREPGKFSAWINGIASRLTKSCSISRRSRAGLDDAAAQRVLERVGPNRLEPPRPISALRILARSIQKRRRLSVDRGGRHLVRPWRSHRVDRDCGRPGHQHAHRFRDRAPRPPRDGSASSIRRRRRRPSSDRDSFASSMRRRSCQATSSSSTSAGAFPLTRG